MSKIYGYKDSDATKFLEYLKNNKTKSLTQIFEGFAKQQNKAKGTIRNLYYAIAKKSAEDEKFCMDYLDGKALSVNKITEFTDSEEKDLLKKVLIGRSQGRSVRSVINDLANGDMKTALRYQNKFRTLVKGNPTLISSVTNEIRKEVGFEFSPAPKKVYKEKFSNVQYQKLKDGIDALIEKLTLNLKKELEYYKEKLKRTEDENYKLKAILYGEKNVTTALGTVFKERDENILS